MKRILSLLMCSFSICSAFKWPIPGITLCHRSHPDFDKCLAENVPKGMAFFRHGIKEIGFPEAEPVKAPSPFTLNLNGNKNLKYSITYTNTYFSGCTYLTIPEIKTELGDDSDRCGWTIDMRLPKVVLYGDYSVIGKMLMIQLNGHGKFNLTVSNLTMLSIGKCEKYQKSGKTYIKLTNYTVDVNPENVVYYFENLVPGNPEVSAQVIKTLNDDPLLVWNDVKSGLNAVVASIQMNMNNKFFSKVPFDEVFLP